MKAVVEGLEDLEPFSSWLRNNDAALREHLSRGSYLRLKHHQPISELKRILTANGVPFSDAKVAHLTTGPADYAWIKPAWFIERLVPPHASTTILTHESELDIHDLLHSIRVKVAAELQRLIDVKEADDEIWRFSTPSEGWQKKMGASGFALVRGGKIVDAVVTVMT
jgi:hypothetical protein